MTSLLPTLGAWVSDADQPEAIGPVLHHRETPEGIAVVARLGATGEEATIRPGRWRSGLLPGFVVQDVPLSAVRETLGTGTVQATRTLAGRDQALVQFHRTGEAAWLPFERLVRIMDPALRYLRAEADGPRAAERTALRLMGHALRAFNEATGALDRLDVDPLPHQIGLIHRILQSGQTNWLIADDVGLGKTIEVGLLLAALERRGGLRRVLIVAPSGLTRQWKTEMRTKFDRDFLVYGRDFRVEEARDWGRFERVIVSLDLAKPRSADDDGASEATAFGAFLAAGAWDIVIFDEAHRLSRAETGQATLRFRLAEALRQRTDRLVLLTGTPHQGDAGRFRNLLALVRPDLRAAIEGLDERPEVVSEIVLRNRKIDVVDAEGRFLFQGVTVRRVAVQPDAAALDLDRSLQAYLREGYRAGDALGGHQGRAIGFVMTIYRKMASSSAYALLRSLERRRLKLLGTEPGPSAPPGRESDPDWEDALEGDDALGERDPADTGARPFFEGEIALLDDLVTRCKASFRTEAKLIELVRILRQVVQGDGEKLLVFTEYRATQFYLSHVIRQLLGREPAMIHGGMTVDERMAAVAAFEADAPVLIATEAGGEGLNLHRRCHVMVNYDLPWNPSRLSQRIGRLYRYGQTERVVVLNFHAHDTIDNKIVSGLMDRLDTIVREMATVGPEFDHRFAADVMGDLLERLDIRALLDEARGMTEARSAERIKEAIEAAREAKRMQDDVLATLGPAGDDGWRALGGLRTAHLARLIVRAAPFLGIRVEAVSNDGETFTLRLPAEMKGRFAEFGGRLVVEATTRRGGAERTRRTLLDFASGFVRFLVEHVTTPEFGGGFGAAVAPFDLGPGHLFGFLARSGNDQGRPEGEELVVVRADGAGPERDGRAILPLFEGTIADTAPAGLDASRRQEMLLLARGVAEAHLAARATPFRHPNDLVTLAVLEAH